MSIVGEPNLDWGNHGDQCWEFWKVEPCCGRPFNLKDCCYCFWCFACCGSCVLAKLWATSEGKECGVVNHWIPWVLPYLISVVWMIVYYACIIFVPSIAGILYLCSIVPSLASFIIYIALRTFTRVSLRRMHSIGDAKLNLWDAFLVCCPCTSPCELCQELRAVEIEGWDWLNQARTTGLPPNTGFVLMRPENYSGLGQDTKGFGTTTEGPGPMSDTEPAW
eukprot:CAMPEP_0114611948 /NCGR_PEP_ID=MMETSP0168-20121206/4375_1 /TAXON_ID=95228 ORGANISM="Vannella sp., Strain DIVA3 517/6/12" /NCGR_SAMPLE_ID=MMETSP0168 /ASSEMBLY_ACC=CAM_ASM_000044 /LENGTH=220 /DNA_ID=CAMNT_0001822929 /DNA_START=63 /DNA_END=725 /DNA_ORIENTATION=+